jgi:hypothetical protein
MSYVIAQDGTHKAVTNLGWLLRNSDEVFRFDVHGGDTRVVNVYPGQPGAPSTFTIPDEPRGSMDSVMVAHLRDGRTFVTRWTSYAVMLDWLQRPKFSGLPMRWFALETTIPG